MPQKLATNSREAVIEQREKELEPDPNSSQGVRKYQD